MLSLFETFFTGQNLFDPQVLESGEQIGLKHFRPVKPLGSGDTGRLVNKIFLSVLKSFFDVYACFIVPICINSQGSLFDFLFDGYPFALPHYGYQFLA